MTPRELEEYRALRDTIRERGTLRLWVAPAGIAAWASLTVGVIAWAPWPLASLLPLLVLAATFESVYALHTGVERVGRYLQTFYEADGSIRAWESQAMAYGRRFSGGAPDPLFAVFFALGTVFNFVPVVIAGPIPIEYIVVGAVHVLFLARLARARWQAARQRQVDLERFQQLKQTP